MVERICKCCGQTLPPRFDIGLSFSRLRADLVDIVYAAGPHGISTERLFRRLYDLDPDGGPETGHKVLHVMIAQVNKRLRTKGWEIRGERTGTSGVCGMYILCKMQVSPQKAALLVHTAIGTNA